MGLQGGARVGLTKLLGAKVDIDLGSREFSITGKEFVNENYTIGLDVLGFSLQLDASRNVEVRDFRPGIDSIQGILRNHSFGWKPGIGTPWNTSASDFWKIDFGASLLFGIEGSLDFNAIGND